LARMTKKGDAAWFDPQNRNNKRVRIERTLLLEFARAVFRAPLSSGQKFAHLWHLWRHIVFRARRKGFLSSRRSRTQLWKAWTRTAVAAARRSEHSFFPLRAWVMLGALRGNARALKLALSGPWQAPHPALLDYAATHLARYNDPAAEDLLDDWIEHGDRAWWWAALKLRSAEPLIASAARPKLSIRMIVAGEAPHLADALESLLRQGLADFELILERDGASASAVRCIEPFARRGIRIRATAPDAGPPASRAAVLQEARGEYYAEMDPADVVHPDRFLVQIAYLEAHADLAAVSCRMLPIDEQGASIASPSPAERDSFALPAALFVREALIKPSDPHATVEGQLDAAAFGEVATLPRLLHRRRESAG